MSELEFVGMNGISILPHHMELILRNVPIKDEDGCISLDSCNLCDEHLYVLYHHKHLLNDVYELDLSSIFIFLSNFVIK